MPQPIAPVICALVAIVVTSTAAASRQGYASSAAGGELYFVGDFETCDFSQWQQYGLTSAFQIARRRPAEGRCAGTLTVGPEARGIWNGRSDATAIAAPGRPPEYGVSGRTVWQHFSILFPPRFRSTVGDWNWFTEWHNDEGYKSQLRSEFPNICWTVHNSHGVGRLAMRIIGGQSRRPRTIWVDGPRIRRNHWYDFLVRTTWSPDARQGFVQWWLDGKRMFSKHVATLYTRPDGSVSSVYFMQDYYRLHARWTAKVFFDGTRLGSTRGSVRYPS